MKTMLDYCDRCEQDFIEDDVHRQRYYDTEICEECAEAEWEHYNDRQSEYWA